MDSQLSPERPASAIGLNGLRVGIVGAGFAGRSHLEAARRTGLVSRIVLVASSPESTIKAGQELAVETCSSLDELLAQDLDIVHNCTPNSHHVKVTNAILDAGIHVISEKPLATSTQEAEALLDHAERKGVIHATCFNYRFYPLVEEARARIAIGDIGQPILAHGAYLQDWLLFRDDYNWRVSAVAGGHSRAVADIGSHWMDLITFVVGRPVEAVRAHFGRLHERRVKPRKAGPTFLQNNGGGLEVDVETEDYAFLLIRLDGGLLAQALISQVSAGSKNNLWLQVDATQGAIRWEQENPEQLWIRRRGRDSQLVVKDGSTLSAGAKRLASLPAGHPEGWHDALTQLIRAVYSRALRLPAPDFPTFADGVRSASMVDAAIASANSGAWETVKQMPIRTQ